MILLSLILAAVTTATSVGSYTTARLTAPDTTFAYGYVPREAKVSHEYVLRSSGSDTVRVDSIKPSCGCTQAPLPKTALAPGDTTSAELIFSTGSYIGAISKNATVFVTPAQSPLPVLNFTANAVVRPDSTYPIVITPFGVALTQAGPTEATVSIRNDSDQPVHLKLVAGSEDFTVQLPSAVPAGKTARATVTLTESGKRSGFDKSVTLQLDDGTRFTVPVGREYPPSKAIPVSPGK